MLVKLADLKSKPVVTFLSPHGANIGGCSVKSNLLAKTMEHQNSGFFSRLKHSLTFPPPIFPKLSKCSHSGVVAPGAIQPILSNRGFSSLR
jgi:hypothetical protein